MTQQTSEIRYPAAERLARTMTLPLALDPAARQLYGTADVVLDEAAARDALREAGFSPSGRPGAEAAMEILRQRAEAVAARAR